MKKITKSLLNSMLLASSLTLVACGGSNSTAPAEPTPTPTPTPEPTPTTLSEKLVVIDDYLADMQSQGDFNGAVLIAKQGEPLLINTYGFTDVTKTTALTTDSSFRLASMSKQFTTMAVMILQERGLLDYDDLVSQHINELTYDDITIEHLMHHTSGIQDYTFFPESYITEQGAEYMTMPVFFDIIAEHPLNREFTPASQWRYSNTGYILLAEIVERVSGQGFEDFMHDEIFTPLNMGDSDVYNWLSDSQSGRLANRTQGFWGTTPAELTHLDGIAGDGAVFASIADILKWDEALRDNTLVTEQTKLRAFTPAVVSDGTPTNYGYGWSVFTDDGVDYVSHGGSWLGARTMIIRNLTSGGLIVLLDSSSTTKQGEMLQFISSILVDEGI